MSVTVNLSSSCEIPPERLRNQRNSLFFLRNGSTLFELLTIVRYGMGVVFTHVRCLSRSGLDSGWVDKVKMLIPVAAGTASYYINHKSWYCQDPDT